jgi:hypothetical protein
MRHPPDLDGDVIVSVVRLCTPEPDDIHALFPVLIRPG